MSWAPVYQLVKKIPRGRVVTYGQLARALGLPGGARTAGFAIAACPNGQGIPWHRVVGAGGRIRLREPLASLQRRLLESEGAKLIRGRVVMERCQWPLGPGRVRGGKRQRRKPARRPRRR